MLTFYLVRHGQTENNCQLRITGHLDPPLTSEGRTNAQLIGGELRNINFDAIYSSDLGRAHVTADLINQQLLNKHPVETTPALRETNYGIYQNLLKAEVQIECPQYGKDADFVFPEGESIRDTQKRAIDFILNMEQKFPRKTILIVTHAALIRTIICFFQNLPLNLYLDMKITHEYIGKFVIDGKKLISFELLHE